MGVNSNGSQKQNGCQNSKDRTDWQECFLKMLPRIQEILRAEFRHLNPEAKEEAVQEGVVNCLVCYERLARQGRTHVAAASSLAWYAARQVRSGRQAATPLNVRDPLSRYARVRKGLRVQRLDVRDRDTDEWLPVLVEDRRTSVPEQVALRIDVPAWLTGFARRTRRIARDLALGFATSEVARKYKVSPGRISQLRRELYESWQEFQGLTATPGAT